jgi:hypothetical protein
MESTLSTLAELAANLLKLERRVETPSLDTAAHDAMGWDELMPFPQQAESLSPPVAALANAIPTRSRVTVLRLIDGGLA